VPLCQKGLDPASAMSHVIVRGENAAYGMTDTLANYIENNPLMELELIYLKI
jgi:hypothetical protein